mmetsp:Transcript_18426/g.28275  ORF Transcript_18426/g.28275 Transcript_18426/m.28275 type:complete len:99 (+) Transcript_18426:122-418(+)
MTGAEFFSNQVDKSDAFEQPFEIQRPKALEKIKALCEMCSIEEAGFCCPEHCCDWDSCRCSHCKERKALNRKKKFEQEQAIKENNIPEAELCEFKFNV